MNNKIDVSKLKRKWNSAKAVIDQYTSDFPEIDNLIDGVSRNDEGSTGASIGDTTIGGLVRSIPRNSFKQVPVMSATYNGSKKNFEAIVLKYILKSRVFNEDTFGRGLLSTYHMAIEQSFGHGFQPMMAATSQMADDFGTTARLIHYDDVALEPGVSDWNESSYVFVRAHLTKDRIRAIKRAAENNPETTWNVEALDELLNMGTSSYSQAAYNQSDPRSVASGVEYENTYDIITYYEAGVGGKFITFSPEITSAPLRVVENRSKFGYPRVTALVIDPAALNPFGISRVRLASPNQNMMNIYYRQTSSMLLINSDPPLFKRGQFLKPTHLKRKALWETTDPNAQIELKTMDNGSLAHFTNFAQYFASQIQNIMGTPTGTISGGSNQFGFSKTAPGVKMAQEVMDSSTRQITKIVENHVRQYALTALDAIVSELHGSSEVVYVDDDTRNDLESIGHIFEDGSNAVEIDWTALYDNLVTWSIEVDVSLSPDELKEKEYSDLQDMLVVLGQNAQAIPGAPELVSQLSHMLIKDKVPFAQIPDAPEAPMEQGMAQDPQQQGLPPELTLS